MTSNRLEKLRFGQRLTERLTKKEKLDRRSFHVLERKEIESYLIEPHAIAKILNKETNEVETCIAELRGGSGKKNWKRYSKFFMGPRPPAK